MKGVYFSANDKVYDWAVAFLESFRAFNPTLPLFLIPFDNQCNRVFALANEYRFQIFTDSAFTQLEEVGRKLELGLTATGPNWFRRFAAYWGPLETFFYLDCRTLVLCDLEPILDEMLVSGFDLLHYDCTIDQVYQPGRFRVGLLRSSRGRGFNSGRWASKRGVLSLSEFEVAADECTQIREQLNPRNTDQFLLNYCCDMKGLRTTSISDLLGDMCCAGWARQPGMVYWDGGGYRRWDHGGIDHRKRVPLLHWAGIPLSPNMPEAELFFSFRDKRLGSSAQAIRRMQRQFIRPLLRIKQAFRGNRKINMLWHNWKRQ